MTSLLEELSPYMTGSISKKLYAAFIKKSGATNSNGQSVSSFDLTLLPPWHTTTGVIRILLLKRGGHAYQSCRVRMNTVNSVGWGQVVLHVQIQRIRLLTSYLTPTIKEKQTQHPIIKVSYLLWNNLEICFSLFTHVHMILNGCMTLDKTHNNSVVCLFVAKFSPQPDYFERAWLSKTLGMLALQLDFDTHVSERNDQWQVDPLKYEGPTLS